MTALERLKNVFREALGFGSDIDIEKIKYHTTPAWDSIGHMRLIAALEAEFNVMLTTEQILDLSDFNRGIEALRGHGITS